MFRLAAIALSAVMLALSGAAVAHADQDSVTGTAVPANSSTFLFIDAHSGPLGQDAVGTVGNKVGVSPVRCLAVTNNQAVVGYGEASTFSALLVTDNGATVPGTVQFAPSLW